MNQEVMNVFSPAVAAQTFDQIRISIAFDNESVEIVLHLGQSMCSRSAHAIA